MNCVVLGILLVLLQLLPIPNFATQQMTLSCDQDPTIEAPFISSLWELSFQAGYRV